MGFAPVAQITGAVLLILGAGPVIASESLRTRGSVQILDSAGMTVIQDPPLLFILSSGNSPRVRPLVPIETVFYAKVSADRPFMVEYSGFYPRMSGSGEVLSVIVTNESEGNNENIRRLGAVIAQFN